MARIIDHEGTVHDAKDDPRSPFVAACGYPPRMKDGEPWERTARTQPSYHWGSTGAPITCEWCLIEQGG
jgi:hypothetical protein